MRTRNAGYIDYGITDGECTELLKICRNAYSEQEFLLLKAAQESNEDVAEELFCSLHDGVSFEHLDTLRGLHFITKEDFYAYRRKALFLFKEKLMANEQGIIEKWQKDGQLRRYASLENAAEELEINEGYARTIAKRANALVKLGNLFRVDMNALYNYIDRECVVK